MVVTAYNLAYFFDMQAKIVGKPSYAGSFPGYDEYVPMVDKPVDVSWKKQVSFQRPYVSKGYKVYPRPIV